MARKKKFPQKPPLPDIMKGNDLPPFDEKWRQIKETPFAEFPPASPDAINKETIDYFVEKMSTEIAAKLAVLMPQMIKPPSPGIIAKPPTEEQVKQLDTQLARLFDLFMEYIMSARLSRI